MEEFDARRIRENRQRDMERIRRMGEMRRARATMYETFQNESNNRLVSSNDSTSRRIIAHFERSQTRASPSESTDHRFALQLQDEQRIENHENVPILLEQRYNNSEFDSVQMALALARSLREHQSNRGSEDTVDAGTQEWPDMSYEALVELEDVKVGLTQPQMEELCLSANPVVDSPQRCPICWRKMKSSIRQIRACKHNFHEDCLFRWWSQSKKCPLCNERPHSTEESI